MTEQYTRNANAHVFYFNWYDMDKWCNNTECANYKYYGGRGIKVCPEWQRGNPVGLQNYSDYIKVSLDPRPDNVYTIERINKDGDYEPGNIRWANPSEQSQKLQKIRATNIYGYWGVSLDSRTGRYRAYIEVNNRRIHLGYHDTALEAAIAYDQFVVDNNLSHTTNGLLEGQSKG